jgi:hypothetical protein
MGGFAIGFGFGPQRYGQATGGPGVDTTNFAIDEDGSFLADEDGTIFELEAL